MKSKPKKISSSTGFGSTKSSLNAPYHKSFSKSSSNTKNSSRKEPTIKEKTTPIVEDDDKDLNSGFGDYIRSPEAAEMMKLFVVANSIVLIITMAWPGIKEIYRTFEEWWFYKNLNI